MKRLFGVLAGFVMAALSLPGPIAAAELGDDGLHNAPWQRETFLDLREDLAEATAEGRRLMITIEQRGCIYCTRMYEQVFPEPEIDALLTDDFFVVQLNMFGDLEVTDFDGTTMGEKDMIRHWGINFTPTVLFYPKDVPADQAGMGAVAVNMPGAFGKWTTLNMMTWVLEEGYLGDENFQKYHARKVETQLQN